MTATEFANSFDWNKTTFEVHSWCILAQSMLKQLDEENKALKAFVKPILVHGGDGVGDWDGYELQELAVKSGLFISKMMKEPCNLGNEDKLGCLCREYCYGEDEWECYRINAFLLGDEK